MDANAGLKELLGHIDDARLSAKYLYDPPPEGVVQALDNAAEAVARELAKKEGKR